MALLRYLTPFNNGFCKKLLLSSDTKKSQGKLSLKNELQKV